LAANAEYHIRNICNFVLPTYDKTENQNIANHQPMVDYIFCQNSAK